MTTDITGSLFGRATEAPEEVVLPRVVVGTQGLQPEDFGALVFMLLLEPGSQRTGKDLAAGMRQLGWKMSDDRFEKVAKRLTAAGHLRRESVYDPATKRPKWHYSIYRNPANNPRYVSEGATALSQVSGEARENPVPAAEQLFESRENRILPGQGRNPGKPESGAEPGKTGFPSEGVSTGQSRKPEKTGSASPPPHPPGEEESSSPNPLTGPARSLPSQREEEAELSPAEIAAAEDFLQQMERWQAGAATARRCAPKLVRTMRRQGWPSLLEMDREGRLLLEGDVLKNTGGAASWTKCLPGWVEDLRRYAQVRPRTAPAPSRGTRPASARAVIAACPLCDEYGWVLDDDDSGPQRRCSHPGMTGSHTEAAQ